MSGNYAFRSPGDLPDDTQAHDDASVDPRAEVNAYAGAILARLLAIVGDVPDQQREDVQGIEREIHQMLAFVDPELAADVADLPPRVDAGDWGMPGQPALAAIDGQLETLIRKLEESDLQRETTIEHLRDVRATLYTLREDLRRQHDETAESLRTLTSTTRSLHYTMTALSARSEQIADVSGVAEEQIRVDVWKYALIAGLSSGAIVAAIMLVFDIVR